ncbi:GyrI-like domain-containing protein [Flavobacteriaceae bacterium D16]|nr:GyrI-like domain-containing protein [Flavobacteriaceae bacterium D16]
MKKIVISLGVLLVLGIVWYLFLYPYDYVVRMQVKTFPEAITQTLKLWERDNSHMKLLEKNGTESFTMELSFSDSTHIYQWDILPVNDSLTKINVFARDKAHSLKNKISVPFTETVFEKRTKKTLTDFLTVINEHIDNFKVGKVLEEQFSGKTCLCASRNTSQLDKANGMMKDFPLLNNAILKYRLEPDGPPLIEITEWNKEADSLRFNFCFPVKLPDSLLNIPELFFKEIPPTKALKAEYRGNYITSDRAWYRISDYAKNNNIPIAELPIEVFHNNPNLGGDALQWRAEIYIPLKDAR